MFLAVGSAHMFHFRSVLVFGGRSCSFPSSARRLIRISVVNGSLVPPARSGIKLLHPNISQKYITNCTSSLCRLPLSSSRYFCSWEVEAKMRTIADVTKESPTKTVVEENSTNQKKAAPDYRLSSSEVSENESKITRSKSEGESSSRPGSLISEMDGRDTKVDIRKLKDEVASLTTPTPLLRNKNGKDLTGPDAEKLCEKQPLLKGEQRRRRCTSPDVPPIRQHSLRDDVEHAAHETYLVTRLSFNLLRYLGLGYKWITKLFALFLYAIFLMPGFLRVGYQYFFSKNVHRSILYGDQPRNRFDLYLPDNTDGPKPVVIFITGGAWIIGYKAWGSLLGLQLVERDIIVCCVDYRNFPQGRISDMVQDVCSGIGFIVKNIEDYGGDPDRIFLAGQSAGSHLAACAMVDQARKETGPCEQSMDWKCSHIKAFLGISGGYNLYELVEHFNTRGLHRKIFLSVMEEDISAPEPRYSPELVVLRDSFKEAVPLLPPVYLFHGTGDYSIPHQASVTFAEALQSKGATVKLTLYNGKTHTDLFLQDPMRGGHDLLFEDVVAIVHADDEEARARDAQAPPRPRLVPEFLLQLARAVSPF